MTMTIMEMTRLFYKVIDKNTDEARVNPSSELLSKLEKMIRNINNYDDLMTAAAMLCTCVVRYDLGEDYTTTALDVMEKVLGREDETLTHIVKGICENNFKEIDLSFEKEHCTVSKLLHFVRQMTYYYNYSDCSSDGYDYEELFSALAKEFSEFDEDVQDYLLREGDYDKEKLPEEFEYFDSNPVAPNWLLPYFIFESNKEMLLDNFASHIISGEKQFLKKDMENICDSYMDNGDDLSDWNTDYIEHDDRPFTKNNELHIPVFLPGMNNLRQRFKDRLERDRANEELEQASKQLKEYNEMLKEERNEKDKIISGFSHKFKNMRTTSLANLALALLKNEDEKIKKLGRTALLEFGIKISTIKEVEMLRLQYEDDNNELISRIRNSVKAEHIKSHTIRQVYNLAIQRCLVSVLYDGTEEFESIKDICLKNIYSPEIDNKFETEVILSSKENAAIDWLNNHIMKIDFQCTGSFEKLYMQNGQYAELIFTDLFSELLLNMIKYADKSKPAKLILEDENDCLIVKSVNLTIEDHSNIPSSKQGLESQKVFLHKLNQSVGKNLTETVNCYEQNGEYNVKVSIEKNIFWS